MSGALFITISIRSVADDQLVFTGQIGADDDLGARALRVLHRVDRATLDESISRIRASRRALLSDGGAGGGSGATPDGDLAIHGQLAFDVLLPAALKAWVRAAPGGALLIVGEPGLRVPWALLHDSRGFLGRRFALGGARAIERWPPESTERPADRILIVADPAEDLPAARPEGQAVAAALGERTDSIPYDLRLGRLPRAHMLAALRSYSVVHFAGHVDPATETERGGWRLADGHLDAPTLAHLAGGPIARLVVANGCRSGGPTGRALLDAGVRHLIATDVDLPDLQGADLARDLYRALVAGAPVGEALRRARAEAARRGDSSWTAYRLYGDPRTRYAPEVSAAPRTTLRRVAALAVRRPTGHLELEARVLAARDWRARVDAIVAAHGGRLLPRAGLIERAIFGVPDRRADDTLRAARAALALSDEAADVTLAISCGRLALIGDEAIGGPLDVVERLCAIDRRGVQLDEAARRALGGVAELSEDRDRLLGLAAAPRPVGPFVGRGDALARLDHLAERVITRGEGATLALSGPPGIGKSRLLQVMRARLSPRFLVVEAGAGHAGPLGVLRDVVCRLCGLAGDEPPEACRARVDELLATREREAFLPIDELLDEVDDTDARWATLLADLVGHRLPARHQLEPAELGQAFRALLVALAAEPVPLALVFDDLSAVPGASRGAIDALLVDQPPVLLLLADRSDAAFERCPPTVTRVPLGPLPERDARALLVALRPAAESEAIDRRLALAEGHPLFLHALSNHVGGALLPDSVEASVQSRIDRLPPDEQAVLRAAAIFGCDFWQAGVAALVGRSVDGDLERLAEQRMIHRSASSTLTGQVQWAFEHRVAQAVLEQSLSTEARRALNGRAALWLSEEQGTPLGERAARIARHRTAAGDRQRAIDDWLVAADLAESSAAPDDARAALRAAESLYVRSPADTVDPAARARLWARLAEFDRLDGDLEAAAARFTAALADTPTESVADRAWRASRLAAVELSRGRHDAAQAAVGAALDAIDGHEVPPAIRADVICRAATIDHHRGALDQARRRLTDLLETLPADTPAAHGMAWHLLGTVAQQQGELDEAHRWLRRALTTATRDGERVRVLHGLAVLAVRRGDFDEAARFYARTARLRARRGDRSGLARTYNNLGTLYGEQGDYARAARYLDEAIRIRARIGHASLAISCANLAEVHLSAGALDTAEHTVKRVVELLEEGGVPHWARSELWRIVADVRLKAGAVDDARRAAERALSIACEMADPIAQASALAVHARLASDDDEAAATLDEALGLAEAAEAIDLMVTLSRQLAARVAERDPARADELRALADALGEGG